MGNATLNPESSNIDEPNSSLDALNREILRLRKQVRQLREQVRTDTLTGMFNRHHMNETLEVELERSRRTLLPTSLLLMDVDHFKSINDQHGHLAGDKALCHISELITKAIRKLDTACRFGGEEFAIILPSTHLFTAVQVAERLRKSIINHPLNLQDGSQLELRASFGISSYNEILDQNVETPTVLSQLIGDADKQLYKAKAQGRNQVCYAEHDQSVSDFGASL